MDLSPLRIVFTYYRTAIIFVGLCGGAIFADWRATQKYKARKAEAAAKVKERDIRTII